MVDPRPAILRRERRLKGSQNEVGDDFRDEIGRSQCARRASELACQDTQKGKEWSIQRPGEKMRVIIYQVSYSLSLSFLGVLGVLAAKLMAMKITHVEAIHLRLPEVNERCDGSQETLVVK